MSLMNDVIVAKSGLEGGRGHCPNKAKVWDRQLIGQHAPQMIITANQFITIYHSTNTSPSIRSSLDQEE